MTVQEAARALEVAPRVVYDLCRAGLLGHQRIGVRRGVIRITEADLAAYVASRRVEPRGAAPAPVSGGRTGLAVEDLVGRAMAERERKKCLRLK
jgi:excisionase family DNA binding protein